MKTRDRILHTSLLLFNEEGEAGTTTVDIANEMDISPGNLYYHFRGKDSIIAELFGQYELSLNETLAAPVENALRVEDNWFYFYIVFEEMYNYRFLYRNLSELLRRYPALKRRFRRLLKSKQTAIRAIWRDLCAAEVVRSGSRAEVETLMDNVVVVLSYWLNYDQLLHDEQPPALIIHRGVYQLMSLLAPYMGAQQQEFYQQLQGVYQKARTAAAAG